MINNTLKFGPGAALFSKKTFDLRKRLDNHLKKWNGHVSKVEYDAFKELEEEYTDVSIYDNKGLDANLVDLNYHFIKDDVIQSFVDRIYKVYGHRNDVYGIEYPRVEKIEGHDEDTYVVGGIDQYGPTNFNSMLCNTNIDDVENGVGNMYSEDVRGFFRKIKDNTIDGRGRRASDVYGASEKDIANDEYKELPLFMVWDVIYTVEGKHIIAMKDIIDAYIDDDYVSYNDVTLENGIRYGKLVLTFELNIENDYDDEHYSVDDYGVTYPNGYPIERFEITPNGNYGVYEDFTIGKNEGFTISIALGHESSELLDYVSNILKVKYGIKNVEINFESLVE